MIRYKALQLLELGRGILANLQLEVRSDISVLAVDHPDICPSIPGTSKSNRFSIENIGVGYDRGSVS